MTLGDFVKEERQLLDEFLAYWMPLHVIKPHTFPIDMSSGDWDEQFTLWAEERGRQKVNNKPG